MGRLSWILMTWSRIWKGSTLITLHQFRVFDSARQASSCTYLYQAWYFAQPVFDRSALRAMLLVWTGYRAALPKDMERSRVYIELEILRTLRR